MFDPDYRKTPWNVSKYAPKNNSAKNPVTSISFVTSLMMVGAFYLLLNALNIAINLPILVVMFVVWFVLAAAIAGTLLGRESKRLRLLKQEADNEKAKRVAKSTAGRGRDFEELTARVISIVTGMKAELTNGGGDGGVDVNLYRSGKLVGIVQCKNYDPLKALPPGYIRELATVKRDQKVEYAYLVTTAYFSKQSEREAERLGINLIDASEFADLKKRAKEIVAERRKQ